jgi:hypothetical protein
VTAADTLERMLDDIEAHDPEDAARLRAAFSQPRNIHHAALIADDIEGTWLAWCGRWNTPKEER